MGHSAPSTFSAVYESYLGYVVSREALDVQLQVEEVGKAQCVSEGRFVDVD